MNTSGFIVIRHSILEIITESTCEEVIRKDYSGKSARLKFKHVAIEPISDLPLPHREIKDINWTRAALKQDSTYEDTVKPLLQKHPDYAVVYFGAAPIPLAAHMGSLMGTWRNITVYLKNHEGAKQWYQFPQGAPPAELKASGVPKEKYAFKDDILIRVAVSYEIDRDETMDSLGDGIAKEIDIFLDPVVRDLDSSEEAIKVADEFGRALKAVSDYLKQADTVHLIATVPVGLAFLLGTQISANVTQPIQMYQYLRGEQFPYDPVLMINSDLSGYLCLSKEQLDRAQKIKTGFKSKCWQNVLAFIANEKNTLEKARLKNWFDFVLDKGAYTKQLHTDRWQPLPFISNTPLLQAKFDDKTNLDGFQFIEAEGSWKVGNDLIFGMYNKLNEQRNETFRGIRMLLFHEGVHFWSHGLNDATAQGIGRFPKILEESDYQADVWAMLYEYGYSKMYLTSEIEPGKEAAFFIKIIELALATMWSFDDMGIDLRQIQVRRLNRYLIWYWQLLRLEDIRNQSIEDVIKVLSVLPLIEIKGLIHRAEGHRIFFRLDRFDPTDLEIGLLWNNRIVRTGNLGFFRVEDLVDNFRNRNSSKIKEVLKGLYRSLS